MHFRGLIEPLHNRFSSQTTVSFDPNMNFSSVINPSFDSNKLSCSISCARYPQDLPVLSCAFNFTGNITLNRSFESVNCRLENSCYQVISTCEGSVGAICEPILQVHKKRISLFMNQTLLLHPRAHYIHYKE